MWHFYCLPGRVITEFGYLFPKRGQVTATARRRESGFAAFLFATVFWALALPFLLPLLIGIVVLLLHGLGTIALPVGSDTRPAAAVRLVQDKPPETSDLNARAVDRPAADDPAEPPLPAWARPAPRPRVVFAPRHEVVQALDASTGPATQPCSATVTDHCVER